LLELSSNTFLGIMLIVVSELTLNLRDDVVDVFLRKDFLMSYWLHGGVVVILVYLSIDSFLSHLMSVGLDYFGHDGRGDILVHIGSVALSGGDLADSGSGGVHDE